MKNAELSAKKALKIRKMPPTNKAKCYENTNSEYTT